MKRVPVCVGVCTRDGLGVAHTVGSAKAAIIADARSVHSEAELRLCRVRMHSVRRMQPP